MTGLGLTLTFLRDEKGAICNFWVEDQSVSAIRPAILVICRKNKRD